MPRIRIGIYSLDIVTSCVDLFSCFLQWTVIRLKHRFIFAVVVFSLLAAPAVEAFETNLDTPANVIGVPIDPTYLSMASSTEEEPLETPPWWSMEDWSPKTKVVVFNVGVLTAIGIYGISAWDYGSSSFNWGHEEWFDKDTKYGGADKLGHAWTTYALSSLYGKFYEDWGYSHSQAIWMGSATSLLQVTLVEVADGFSETQGFDWGDELMNTLGAGMSYLRHRYPSFREKVDFRMEWIPSPAIRHGDRFDVFTDYSGQKYLLAFKVDGFLHSGDPILKALELHVGYYTRGYGDDDEKYFDDLTRHGYIGIGLNMTYMLEKFTGHRAGNVFDYIQVPYTYISTDHTYR